VVAATGAISTTTTNGAGASTRVPFEGRNSLRQSGRNTIDMRISKRFNVGGRRQVEALWEAFNIFNTINYTSFGTTQYRVGSSSFDAAANKATVNLTEDTGFNVATGASNTLFGPRDMQIGVRFLW
jgi:hypothetical protein